MELSERLDPEELREVLAAYQQVCASVVRRFEGHIARYFGDGIMVYFGFPRAHEDEAQRAVRSGLGIVEAVSQLNTRLEHDHDVRLRVRVGIHTGLVVAGDIAPGEELEAMAAIGKTPNIAARLQGLAEPESIVISSATYRLIAGLFDCRELGFRPIRGISNPMAIYQVLHESGARTRLDVAALHGLPPMAGRDAALAVLTERWRQARAGDGQVVQLVGEPGIGKSRLMWALEEHVAQAPEASQVKLSCSPYYQNTAFYPVVDVLERTLLQFEADDTVEQRLDKIDGYLTQYGFSLPDFVPLVADLLSVPFEGRYARPDVPADRRRQLAIDAIVRTILLRAANQPLLFLVEDLQWADPSTLDLLTELIDRLSSARLLVVLSFRPEFASPWSELPRVEQINLYRLDQDASVAIVTEVAGKPLPAELLGQLLGKADGVPLYLEELTKLVLELGLLRERNGRFDLTGPVPPLAIPATLADSLMARLDRLTSAKSVAQLGATIGRHFSYELLAGVLRTAGGVDESTLKRDLSRLVDSGLMFVARGGRSATYTFKHALIQDVAYDSLLRSTRQQYHQRIAQVLTDQFPATLEMAPELMAHHYRQAGLVAESVPYWLRAGKRALQASANPEAIAHLGTGLDLLTSLPAGPERIAQELEFRLTIGPAYMATLGYAAAQVESCYERARELCRQLGDAPPLAPVLYGLWTYHIVRAQHRSAFELASQILDIGAATDDAGLLIQGNLAVGWSHFFQGRLAPAREHLERVFELYDDDRHRSHSFTFGDNPLTSAGGCLAQVLWLLGHPDEALRRSEDTVAYLRAINHPYSTAFGLDLAGFVRQYRGDPAATRVLTEEAVALSDGQGLAFIGAMGSILRGWSLSQDAGLEAGITQMRQGLESQLRTGAELAKPYWYWLLAEAHRRAGAVSEGLALLDLADEAVERTNERYWQPDIHRLRGQLLASQLAGGGRPSAEECYRRALGIARHQDARSLELRAAIGLALLWRNDGRVTEAHDLLVPAYEWFTEGFETPDLREAAELLADLGVKAGHPTQATLRGGR